MRILRVRFKNLNSLAGEWDIDLQDPVFTSSGIFAITGPTGSGKTTILDAICLALYGQTPRLASISATTNEIMTRHTGECFAEVTFESSHGIFRCTWYQNRAGKRPDGKLQPPDHEIVDGVTGIVITHKIKEVSVKVREVTGMDFHQFTRSMLLAQGGFAAFLNAKPDDRAPILEQITGTGIYSDISIRVHERTQEERENLRVLEEKAGAIILLSPEETGSLISEKEEKEKTLTGIGYTIESLQKYLDLLSRVSKLRDEIRGHKDEQGLLAAKRQEAVTDLHRLELGRKAAVHETAWSVLSGLRAREKQESQTLGNLMTQSSSLQEALGNAESAHTETVNGVLQVQADSNNQRPVLNQVRELDIQIEITGNSARELAKTVGAKKNRRTVSCDELAHLWSEKEDLERKRSYAATYLTDHSDDSLLIGACSGIHERFSVWQKSHDDLITATRDLKKAQKTLTTARLTHEEKKKALAAGKLELDDRNAKITELKQQVSDLMQDISISDIRKREHDIGERIRNLKRLQEVLVSEEGYREDLQKLVADAGVLEASKKEQEQSRSDLVLHQIRQEHLVESEEKAYRMVLLVRNLTDHRTHLQEGEPCPLCGSCDHPYVDGEIPGLDADESGLAAARNQLKEIHASIENLNVAIASITTAITSNLQEQTKTENLIVDAVECSATGAEDLGLVSDIKNRREQVTIALESAEENVVKTSLQISRYDELDTQIRTLEGQLGTAKERHTAIIAAELDAASSLNAAEGDLSRVQSGKDDLELSFAAFHEDLTDSLMRFQVPAITSDTIKEIETILKDRSDKIQKCDVLIQDLDPKIADLNGRIGHSERAIIELDEEIILVSGDLLKKEHLLSTLQKERADLFGTKDPQIEEDRLNQAVLTAEEVMETARKVVEEKRGACDIIAGQIQSITLSLQNTRTDARNQTNSFLQEITGSGFSDEAAFLAALLAPADLESLKTQEAGFEREETRLKALITDKERTLVLVEHEVSLSGHREIDNPETTLQESVGIRDRLLEEITRIGITLENDRSRREQAAGSLSLIEAQRREMQKWERLHSLIGSADGKKFRVFAQGLTFQILIAQANRHLKVMTDRYLLHADSNVPLDLFVVDTWQAGDIRSTKNLSGGESFIVSLSLALGLSGMVSKNVRVDSLFLDEGFGTLDDEALDVAISVLSGLYQEGKLIGVISHVPAIKERISARIVVEKRSHGRSVIIAPGCRRIT